MVFPRSVRYTESRMSDDHQPEANGIFSGNATEVRSQEQQQNKADEHQTERSYDGNRDVRSDARSVYNAKQAAAYVGKDEKTVRNWIRTGRIHAEKPHGKWEIAKAELNAVLADEFKSGDRKADPALLKAAQDLVDSQRAQITILLYWKLQNGPYACWTPQKAR